MKDNCFLGCIYIIIIGALAYAGFMAVVWLIGILWVVLLFMGCLFQILINTIPTILILILIETLLFLIWRKYKLNHWNDNKCKELYSTIVKDYNMTWLICEDKVDGSGDAFDFHVLSVLVLIIMQYIFSGGFNVLRWAPLHVGDHILGFKDCVLPLNLSVRIWITWIILILMQFIPLGIASNLFSGALRKKAQRSANDYVESQNVELRVEGDRARRAAALEAERRVEHQKFLEKQRQEYMAEEARARIESEKRKAEQERLFRQQREKSISKFKMAMRVFNSLKAEIDKAGKEALFIEFDEIDGGINSTNLKEIFEDGKFDEYQEIIDDIIQEMENLADKARKVYFKTSDKKSKEETIKDEIKEAYKVIRLPLGAGIVEVKNARRILSQKYHPDLAINTTPEIRAMAEAKQIEINKACDFIIDHLTKNGTKL